MIPEEIVDKILQNADIVKVVGEFVKLRKAGVNYKGCCPFHDERTASFVVSPAKGIYKCFGCGTLLSQRNGRRCARHPCG